MVLANHQNIVVGVDGSTEAWAAARWAGSTAARLDSPLRVVCAVYPPTSFAAESSVVVADEVWRLQREGAARIVDRTVADLYSEHPALRITTSVHASNPASLLIEEASSARMLVIGNAGTGLIASALLGSTARQVLDEAPCPVLVWRGSLDERERVTPAEREAEPIVVGIDGSVASAEAVREAFDIAASFGVTLLAVHAWNPASRAGGVEIPTMIDWAMVEAEESALLAENVAGWSEKYPDVTVRQVVRQEHPGRTLVGMSEGAQLVVVGSRGRGPLASAVLGSVSSNLAHHALCPVMICRPRRAES